MGVAGVLVVVGLVNIILAVEVRIWQVSLYMSQLLLLGKFEYGKGPIFKVVLEC